MLTCAVGIQHLFWDRGSIYFLGNFTSDQLSTLALMYNPFSIGLQLAVYMYVTPGAYLFENSYWEEIEEIMDSIGNRYTTSLL